MTSICAGTVPDHPNLGVIGSNHQGAGAFVPGAGAITLTHGPSGAAVTHSAQLHGKIRFISENGISGVFHIGTGKVTLDR